MEFWIAAAGIGLAVTALLLLALLRGRAGGEPAAAYDLRVYRDQLREVDRDLARGVIAPADAERPTVTVTNAAATPPEVRQRPISTTAVSSTDLADLVSTQ